MLGFKKITGYLHSKPSSSHFKVKVLNTYFSNSIKPTHKLINLDNFDTLEFYILQDKKNETNIFLLNIDFYKEDYSNTICVAEFESKKEAEDALVILRNKVFGTEKTYLKLATTTFITIVYLVMFINMLTWFKGLIPFANSSNTIAGIQMPASPNGLTDSQNQQMANIQKQLLQQAQAQIMSGQISVGQPNQQLSQLQQQSQPAPAPAVDVPVTEGTEMLKKLK